MHNPVTFKGWAFERAVCETQEHAFFSLPCFPSFLFTAPLPRPLYPRSRLRLLRVEDGSSRAILQRTVWKPTLYFDAYVDNWGFDQPEDLGRKFYYLTFERHLGNSLTRLPCYPRALDDAESNSSELRRRMGTR